MSNYSNGNENRSSGFLGRAALGAGLGAAGLGAGSVGYKAYKQYAKNMAELERKRKRRLRIGKGLGAAYAVGAGLIMANEAFQAAKAGRAYSKASRSYSRNAGRAAGSGFTPKPSGKAQAAKYFGFEGGMPSNEEINRRVRQMAMKHHPDRGGSPEKMKEVNRMFDMWKTGAVKFAAFADEYTDILRRHVA